MTAHSKIATALVALLVASSGAGMLAAAGGTGTGTGGPTDVVHAQEETTTEGETADGEATTTEDETADEEVTTTEDETDEAEDAGQNVTTEDEGPTGEPSPLAGVTFTNQTSNGSAVVVQMVSINTTKPPGGFVVIHRAANVSGNLMAGDVTDNITTNETGEIVGVSQYLEQGAHRNVTVQLNQTLEGSQTLIAVAYRDTRTNQEFSADVDQQIIINDTVVADAAVVTVSDGTEATDGTETADGADAEADDETSADEETPVDDETPADDETTTTEEAA